MLTRTCCKAYKMFLQGFQEVAVRLTRTCCKTYKNLLKGLQDFIARTYKNLLHVHKSYNYISQESALGRFRSAKRAYAGFCLFIQKVY
ncbi:MAG: hypothetical protein J6X78_01890 [Treponema sp.]|nr:hypothetical protein [Treponema sp.]